MAKDFVLDVTGNNAVISVANFLMDLLEKKALDALLMQKELPTGDNVVQSLLTSRVDGVNSFAPVMPVNSAIVVSEMTRIKPSDKRIGVVLRSCEIRAMIELVKLQQVSLENVTVIGVDCPGTFSVNDYREKVKRGEDPTREVLGSIRTGGGPAGVRESCRVCEYPVPDNCDITIGVFGMDTEKQVLIQANTAGGENITTALGLRALGDGSARTKAVAEINAARIKRRDELLTSTQKAAGGLDNLISYFATCIGCHNCMKVCPICYCRQCLFESTTFEHEFSRYFRQASKKKSMRLPEDTILFHLGRMNHMVASCVDCGMCEQACPSRIELLKIFKYVGHNVKKVFDYVPGRSLSEELPIAVFKEEELEPR